MPAGTPGGIIGFGRFLTWMAFSAARCGLSPGCVAAQPGGRIRASSRPDPGPPAHHREARGGTSLSQIRWQPTLPGKQRQAHTGEQRVRARRRRMLVNRGGDPERDDYGLPPVDIEIPDDARELDRDIQAYRRELRLQRRHRLVRRLGGPLTRDGMVLPLLASCLALTLLAGTLLTMFTARHARTWRAADHQRTTAVQPRGGSGRRPAARRQCHHGRQWPVPAAA